MNAPLIHEHSAASQVARPPLTSVPAPRDRSIGTILLEAGRLRPGDVEQVVAHQRKARTRFGEAAVALGLVRETELRAALAYQFDHLVVTPGSSAISREVIAAYDLGNPVLDEIRALRNQVLLRWLTAEDQRNRVVAVMSPVHGEGRTFIAANLAVTFSQMGQRTLLIDADMRRPRVHRLFGIVNCAGLSAMLSERRVPHTLHRIDGLRDLSVVPVGGQPPNPQDLLSRDGFSELLEAFSQTYDVIIVDTPAALHSPEASMIAARAKGCIVVARHRHTRFAAIAELGRELVTLGATIIGTVYSRA
jgi:protein-tyrosine kinase